jgi:hypothetical protein
MDVQSLVEQARDTLGARREYGEPYERDGVTIIPASSVRGGGGGTDDEDHGGGGFGLTAKPSGAWVIKGGEVTWKPAVDAGRIIVGAELVAAAALLARRRRPLRLQLPHRRRAHRLQRLVARVPRRHAPRSRFASLPFR